MSHFYGYLSGNRGTATRCGSRESGIGAHLRSWHNDVFAVLRDKDGTDVLDIRIPQGLKCFINGVDISETKIERLKRELMK